MKILNLLLAIRFIFAFKSDVNFYRKDQNVDTIKTLMSSWISERSKLKKLQEMRKKLKMLKMTIELPKEVQKEREKQAIFV